MKNKYFHVQEKDFWSALVVGEYFSWAGGWGWIGSGEGKGDSHMGKKSPEDYNQSQYDN